MGQPPGQPLGHPPPRLPGYNPMLFFKASVANLTPISLAALKTQLPALASFSRVPGPLPFLASVSASATDARALSSSTVFAFWRRVERSSANSDARAFKSKVPFDSCQTRSYLVIEPFD